MIRIVIEDGRRSIASIRTPVSPLRNAGRRLVEQQHLRLERQRERDPDEALLTIGEQRRLLAGDARQMKLDQELFRLGENLFALYRGAPEVEAFAAPLADREIEVFEHAEPRKEARDLKRADEAELGSSSGAQTRNIATEQAHASRRRRNRAGQQADQRGLARAVRPDQSVARAPFQTERDAVRDRQAAIALDEVPSFERDVAHAGVAPPASLSQAALAAPSSPPRAKRTTTISRRPMANIQ